jgi:glyoxylase-like metal-dependent hydrolase (beta-lactamase superfamily II)
MIIIGEIKKDIETYKKYIRGDVVITLPDTVFDDEINFPEDEVKFFYSPGHTDDSSSCFDKKDKVLFVADNIEDPIPYIRSNLDGVKLYIKTLKNYLEMDWLILIPGHGPITNKILLQQNLDYLVNFPKLAEEINVEKHGAYYYDIHMHNLSTLANFSQEEGKTNNAIEYYQEIISINEKVNFLKKEVIERIKNKILELKSNKL